MKTLKKSLCLVLALVFVLSLCTVGAGAAFTDAADIKYVDAVGIMADLGILSGMGDGTFAPTATVTRAQAAKMIAYMILGKDNAERMPATGSFSDVNAGDWYAKYVGYCAKQGIINGMGDGTFRPDDTVTGTQLAKMILCAVGFGKGGEYVGDGWDFNAVADALTNGIYDNSEAADFAAGATREECALYVYNALINVKQQSYKDGEYSDAGNQTFGAKVWKLQNKTGILMTNAAAGNANTEILLDGDSTNTKFAAATDLDLIGHKVRVLYKDVQNTTTGVYTNVYAVSDISTVIKSGKDAKAYTKAASCYAIDNYVLTKDTATAVKNGSDKASYDLIVFGNEVVSFVKSNAYELAQITNVKDGKITIKNNATYTTEKTSDETWILDGTFAKNDFVKVQTVGTKIKVSATEKVEDVLVKNVTGTGDGSKYNGTYTVSAKCANITSAIAANALSVGGTYTLYLDGSAIFAAAVKAAPPAASSVVYFILGYKSTVGGGTDEYGLPIASLNVYKAQFVTADGEVKYVETTADYSNTVTYTQGLYKAAYVDGKYTLTAITLDTATEKTLTGAKFVKVQKIAGQPWFLDTNTNIIVMDKANPFGGDAKGNNLAVTVSNPGYLDGDYTGKTAYMSLVAIPGSTAYTVDAIWITGAAAAPATNPEENSYMYVTSVSPVGTTILSDVPNPVTGTYDTASTYTVYIDGEKATVALTAAPASTGFFTYTKNANGTFTVGAAAVTTVKTVSVGGASTTTLFNGIFSTSDTTLDGKNISALPVVDLRNVTKKITSVADLNALKSTDDAVSITFMVNGLTGAPMGVIYVG